MLKPVRIAPPGPIPKPETPDQRRKRDSLSYETNSAFNLRLHADRSTIGAILQRLGYGWELFTPVQAASKEAKGKLILPRVYPYPQRRQAVYVAACAVMSADRVGRAVLVSRTTILTSIRQARHSGV